MRDAEAIVREARSDQRRAHTRSGSMFVGILQDRIIGLLDRFGEHASAHRNVGE